MTRSDQSFEELPPALAESCRILWPSATLTVERIYGGMTNHNYRITVEHRQRYFAQHQIGGLAMDLVGIDRNRQLLTHQAVARRGIAPEIIYSDPENRVLISAYVDGRDLRPEETREPTVIASVAGLLRTLHSTPAPVGCDSWVSHPFRGLWRNVQLARTHRARGVERIEPALCVMRRFESLRGPWQPVLTHTDLLGSNLMIGGDRLWLIDWEYSGLGDSLYDLGDFAGKNGLPSDALELLLADYLERPPTGAEIAVVELYSITSLVREYFWSVAMAAAADNGFDHANYSDELEDRVLVAVQSRPVTKLLAEVEKTAASRQRGASHDAT